MAVQTQEEDLRPPSSDVMEFDCPSWREVLTIPQEVVAGSLGDSWRGCEGKGMGRSICKKRVLLKGKKSTLSRICCYPDEPF